MGLQWNCVDLDKGIMMIRQALLYTKEKGTYVGPPKTGQPRAICLSPETIAVLKEYRTDQLRQKIRHADIWQDTGFLFTKDDGTPMHPDSITDWLNKFSEENDLPHIHPHAFRHPYVKHATKIFSLRLKFFQAQPLFYALRETRGVFQYLLEGGNRNPFPRSCNKMLSS